MAHKQRKPMTQEDYLAWEARQELKWEFDGFQPIAMVSVTIAHALIQRNILLALTQRLRGGPCAAYGPEVRVPIPSGSYRYPDVFVTCERLDPRTRDVPNPVVVFEILSETTAETDRTVKLPEYLSIPSVQRYVMVEQNLTFLTVVTRTETAWSLTTLRNGATLELPEVAAELPLEEIYRDVEFPPPPE